MSLHAQPNLPVPDDTARVARAAFPHGNTYLNLRDELGTVFTDEDVAALYPNRGRPAEAPWRLALVTVFQFVENLSDRQAADAVRARIDWKYALGLELTDPKLAEAVSIDPAARAVATKTGEVYRGDYLVVAAGSQPNFFRTPGAERHSLPLYSLDDAERLRTRILQVFEDADRDKSLLDQGALNFVIVGAGPTGVETAGALADLIRVTMAAEYKDLAADAARIHVIDHGPRVLGAFSDGAHDYAAKVLQDLGVQLHLGTSVNEIGPGHVLLSDGDT
jgi:NADH dehydrogenase FAD-containing subunit